jgi:hypothetical protein
MTSFDKTTETTTSTEGGRCVQLNETGGGFSLCLDFTDGNGRVQGFPYAQMLNYLLEKNPAEEHGENLPTDRLSIWFSTHDVILTGWRLDALRAWLRAGRVVGVKALEPRYANLEPRKPFVAEIHVTEATQKGGP